MLWLTHNQAEKKRPLFFLSHSTGGLVVKAALIKARGDEQYDVVGDNCYGVAFFGMTWTAFAISTQINLFSSYPAPRVELPLFSNLLGYNSTCNGASVANADLASKAIENQV